MSLGVRALGVFEAFGFGVQGLGVLGQYPCGTETTGGLLVSRARVDGFRLLRV